MNNDTPHTRLHDGWLLDAASGAVPAAVRVLAACHGALNSEAGRTLGAAESAFGAMLEAAPRAALRPGALDAVMSRLGEPEPVEPETGFSQFPCPLTRALAACRNPRWKRKLGGYSEIVLDSLKEPGVHARLLSIPSGKGAPEHDHEGDELTLVISGAFTDGARRYGRGDVCVAGPGAAHRPRVEDPETCVCFVVELGALRPTDPVLAAADRLMGGRLMQ
ncbi:MAG: cupin domain-containing protein [Oceanicaulis sp.]